MNFDNNAYEKTLRRALELLDDLYPKMFDDSFETFEQLIYEAIAEAHHVDKKQVFQDFEDLYYLSTGTED